jgi:hypothetical protein
MLRALLLAAAVLTIGCSAQSDPVLTAAMKLEGIFSNISALAGTPGLGSLFAPNGEWCALMGQPCQTSPANITAYAGGFKKGFGLVDALARFTEVTVSGNYGSFDYVKTFVCTAPCGPRVCLINGKSGFQVDPSTGLVVYLHDYIMADLEEKNCINRCSKC